MTEAQEQEEGTPEQAIKEYIKERKLPINNLDSAWLSAEPDYTEIQNEFNSNEFSQVFALFNSSIRLANIGQSKANLLEYDLVTAGESLDLGLTKLALSVFYDVASVIEVSHGVKGFRTKAMNMIIQEITKKDESKKKKNILGGNKDD